MRSLPMIAVAPSSSNAVGVVPGFEGSAKAAAPNRLVGPSLVDGPRRPLGASLADTHNTPVWPRPSIGPVSPIHPLGPSRRDKLWALSESNGLVDGPRRPNTRAEQC